MTIYSDTRTNNWPLIASPVPGLTILAAYLYFILSWGPKYMANRKPLKLEGILIAYNFIQVIVSTYIFYEVSLKKKEKKSHWIYSECHFEYWSHYVHCFREWPVVGWPIITGDVNQLIHRRDQRGCGYVFFSL